MARNDDASVVVVYVSPSSTGYDMGFGYPAGIEDAEGNERDLMDWLRTEVTATIGTTSVPVELVERTGDSGRQLVETATARTADAIVVGAPEQRRHHLAGSVPAWLARHACCPIVVVP